MRVKRPLSKQPIPPHAKKVFKGKIFDVYQWQQKLFDGTLATFEKIKRTDTVSVLPVTNEGKIILTEQEQPGEKPFVGVLSGRIDKGETPLGAARRELLEEAGYEAEEFVLWDAVQILPKIDWAIYIFIARGCQKRHRTELEAGERIKLKFIAFDEFMKLVAEKNYRDVEIALKVLQLKSDPEELEKSP